MSILVASEPDPVPNVQSGSDRIRIRNTGPEQNGQTFNSYKKLLNKTIWQKFVPVVNANSPNMKMWLPVEYGCSMFHSSDSKLASEFLGEFKTNGVNVLDVY
jgi:hypothetical protein